MRAGLVFLVLCACGDNRTVTDAAPDAERTTPGLGPVIELGLLPPRAPGAVFAHSLEPSIATSGDTIAVAYINLADADPTTYALDGAEDKFVAIATSRDRGESFGPARDPSITSALYSSDPVVRTAPDGTLWAATLGQNLTSDAVALAKSVDGLTWQPVASMPALDKEWIAIDATSVWVGVLGVGPLNFGYFRVDFDGNNLGQSVPLVGTGVTGMYVDAQGVHIAHLSESTNVPIVRWNGSSAPQQEGAQLPVGRDANESSVPYTTAISLGPTSDGGQWIVRTVKRDGYPAIVLRIRQLPDEGVDIPISEADAHAFLPTAIVDEDGRLRVIYYDSAGATGVLRTTRSRSSDWALGFEPSTILDRDVCPGGRWVPEFNTATGGRRLREYIDVAMTSRRIHVAWTASPTAPSRVRTAYFRY